MQNLVAKTHVRRVSLTTHTRSRCSKNLINDIAKRAALLDLALTVSFVDDLHNRELQFSNGIAVTCDRGLDIFMAPRSADKFYRNCTIHVFEVSAKYLADQSDAVNQVVVEAAAILCSSVAQEAAQICANVQAVKPQADSPDSRHIRLKLYETQLTNMVSFTHRNCTRRDEIASIVANAMWCSSAKKHCRDCHCKGKGIDFNTFAARLPRLIAELEGYRLIQPINTGAVQHTLFDPAEPAGLPDCDLDSG